LLPSIPDRKRFPTERNFVCGDKPDQADLLIKSQQPRNAERIWFEMLVEA
jgi:hypothetical protein